MDSREDVAADPNINCPGQLDSSLFILCHQHFGNPTTTDFVYHIHRNSQLFTDIQCFNTSVSQNKRIN